MSPTLNEKKISPPIPVEKASLSLQEFQSFYRKTPESRSSSPSGLHLGYYKAASFSKQFSEILWNVSDLALAHQYPLQRWQMSATTQLEKSGGYPFIHKFYLLESDLNYVMRNLWGWDFMYHNEAFTLLYNNQYGDRKGRQTTSAILN